MKFLFRLFMWFVQLSHNFIYLVRRDIALAGDCKPPFLWMLTMFLLLNFHQKISSSIDSLSHNLAVMVASFSQMIYTCILDVHVLGVFNLGTSSQLNRELYTTYNCEIYDEIKWLFVAQNASRQTETNGTLLLYCEPCFRFVRGNFAVLLLPRSHKTFN